MENGAGSPGKLVLSQAGKPDEEFVLRPGQLIVGRSQVNDIVIPDTTISRSHARLECNGDRCVLADLGSANGSWVNGRRITEAQLNHGDLVRLGDRVLRFEAVAEDPSPEMSVTVVGSSVEEVEKTESEALPIEVSDTRESRLVVHTPNGTSEINVEDGTTRIGRDPKNEVVLNTSGSSRRHALIERRGDSFVLRDLKSTNGTWCRGEKITEHVLEDGDTFRIGSVRMVFKKGFEPQDMTVMAGSGELPSPSDVANRNPVVLVPGMMGSELWAGNQKIWPNPRYILTNPEIATLSDNCPLEARQLVSEVVVVQGVIKLAQYNRLTEHLEEALGYERGKNLLEFPYIPEVSLTLSYFSPLNYSEMLPTHITSVGILFKWEVFDWGRRGRELAERSLTIEQAQSGLEEARSLVAIDVEARFRKLQQTRQLVKIAQLGQERSAENVRVISNKYQQQSSLLKDVLQAQTEHERSRFEREQALLSFWMAQADLEKTVGEDQ